MKFKYDEDKIIKELTDYIECTYNKHYALKGENSPQALDFIFENPEEGYHFCTGNIKKYGLRLGKKDELRSELLKIAHYVILGIYNLERMENINENK